MARPWMPVGFLHTRPSAHVKGAVELDATHRLEDSRPGVWLVLIPGREYLVREEEGVWVVSVR